MTSLSDANRRIARNTAMLYVRTALTMGVALFTSRIVLEALGVDDYGIYSVVGGLVVFFTFLNVAMASATQRFLNYELGRHDPAQMARVFSASVSAHLGVAFLVFLLAETAGLWFLNAKMVIPPGRLAAANWVYQLSVLTTVLQIVRVPYHATILAYERMSFYAHVGVAEAVLRLGGALLLRLGIGDPLKLYALLALGVTAGTWAAYYGYCRRHFDTARYRPVRDGSLMRTILDFSGWSLLGNLANTCNAQGINLLFNLWCGVAVNAAMGLAGQVNAAAFQLVSNFQTAFNPQIIQLCARQDRARFEALVFRASKFSFFLMGLIAVPIVVEAETVLAAWLGTVPDYAAVFLRLTMVSALVEALAGPLWMSAQAFGAIRVYQLVVSLLLLGNLPLAYGVLRLGYGPAWVLGFRVLVQLAALLWRILYYCAKAQVPVHRYAAAVLWPAGQVLALAAGAAWAARSGFRGSLAGGWATVLIVAGSVAAGAWWRGLTPPERRGLRGMWRPRSASPKETA